MPADVSITNKIGRKLLVMMALVAGAAGSLLVWHIVRRSPAAGSATPATSIRMAAVPLKSTAGLPAASQSEDKMNAYFADGIHDEILTRFERLIIGGAEITPHILLPSMTDWTR